MLSRVRFDYYDRYSLVCYPRHSPTRHEDDFKTFFKSKNGKLDENVFQIKIDQHEPCLTNPDVVAAERMCNLYEINKHYGVSTLDFSSYQLNGVKFWDKFKFI